MRRLLVGLAGLVLVVWVPASAVAQDPTVTVGNGAFDYRPRGIEVDAGTTVTWRQTDALPHTVTASDGSFDSHPGCMADGTGDCMADGDTFSFTFVDAGTLTYFCKVHGTAAGGGMAGTVSVTAPPAPDPTETSPPPPPTEVPTGPTPEPSTSAPAAPPAPTSAPTASPQLPETGAGRVFPIALAAAASLLSGVLLASRRRSRDASGT